VLDTALFEDQDMSISNREKEWVAEEIRTAIHQNLRPDGWRTLREWIPLVSIITIMISLLALAGAGWNFAFSRVGDEATFQTKTGDRLDSIEISLRELRALQQPGPVLNEISKLDQKQFAQSLPALRSIATLSVSEVEPSPSVLRIVAEKLRNTPEQSPDYWPTVLQYFQFATSGLSTNVPPPNQPRLTIAQLTLEGPISGKTIELADGVRLENAVFLNCRIIFTNNPVEFRNVKFVDSVFEFPISVSPSKYIRRAVQALMASDLKTVPLG
jgi:hypothetical protein